MSDLRTRLERLGERARPAPDAFAKLDRARRRRDRNRRIAAGSVALLLALGGSIFAISAFRGGESRTADGDEGFFALWPQSTLDGARAAQHGMEAGDPDLQWQLDPQDVALRFADYALGWQNPAMVSLTPTGSSFVDVSVVDVWGSRDIRRQAIVTIDRLVGGESSGVWTSTGVWSVIAVRSPEFDLRFGAGGEVVLGDVIAIPTTLPDGTQVAVGVRAFEPCTGFREQTVEVKGGLIALPVAGVGEGCVGYVYALTLNTPVGQLEPGRIMFAGWNEPKSLLAYTIDAIAAIPVRFVTTDIEPPSVQPVAAEVAELTCDGSTTTLLTPRVAAQPDGVHVRVTNTSSLDLSLQVEGVGGDNAPVGERESVWQLAPGEVRLRCLDPAVDAGSPGGYVTVEVVDPAGLYVSPELGCASVVGMTPEYAEGWMGYQGDPVEAARVLLTGLLEGDVVERAGYPGSTEPIVRIVREGAVVGSVHLRDDGQGGWLLDTLERCDQPGVDFGWADEAAQPYPRGWFEWCPTPPFPEPGRDWKEQASEVALRFVVAYVAGDDATLADLLDESVPRDIEVRAHVFSVVVPEDGAVPAVIGTNAWGGELVRFSCGNDVAAYTVAITMDDGTDSASADFTVYLVLRDGGWKAWGAY
jgi:hypothetical protein